MARKERIINNVADNVSSKKGSRKTVEELFGNPQIRRTPIQKSRI